MKSLLEMLDIIIGTIVLCCLISIPIIIAMLIMVTPLVLVNVCGSWWYILTYVPLLGGSKLITGYLLKKLS